MPLTNAQKQAAHRVRQQAKLTRLTAGYHAIIARLEGRTGKVSAELRTIAKNALAD